MSTIMKSSSFELGTNGAGIDVTSHDDAVTFYVPLTAEQRRALADALVPGRDFSGVDWKAMYDRACRERDKWEEKYLDTDEALHKARASLHEACKVAQSYKVDAYQATERAEVAEARTAPAVSRADVAEALARCLDPEMWNVTFLAVVNEICDLFGIEAEQATDPLLVKAQEFAALADWELTDREAELLHTVAAHVLGQEASDE